MAKVSTYGEGLYNRGCLKKVPNPAPHRASLSSHYCQGEAYDLTQRFTLIFLCAEEEFAEMYPQRSQQLTFCLCTLGRHTLEGDGMLPSIVEKDS